MASIMNVKDIDKTTLTTMYWERSISTLTDADLSIESGRWNSAANRFYYSILYALNALFEKDGNSIKSFRSAKRVLGKKYVLMGKIDAKYGRFFSQLEAMRLKVDFDVSFLATEEEISDYRPKVDDFIATIKKLIDE
ncbi:MAG: HEPN domain-containing protein [Bacteroidales bacterium]|nr:HEPN domain-containing protein [Bacteroidales bacterium]